MTATTTYFKGRNPHPSSVTPDQFKSHIKLATGFDYKQWFEGLYFLRGSQITYSDFGVKYKKQV